MPSIVPNDSSVKEGFTRVPPGLMEKAIGLQRVSVSSRADQVSKEARAKKRHTKSLFLANFQATPNWWVGLVICI